VDNESINMLLEALGKVKDYGWHLEYRREQRLWKKVYIPCSLSDAINSLFKHEMDAIRKNLNLKNLSTLKKADLATELINLIPGQYKRVLHMLDQERYALVKKIAKNGGFVPATDIPISQVESLLEYSIIFPGLCNSQRILYIPQELLDIFSQIDNARLAKIVRRNTEWIRLTQGMLYYYGVADLELIMDRIKQLTTEEVDVLEFLPVLDMASQYYGQIYPWEYGLSDHRILNPEEIRHEHEIRPDIDYYPFTKKQLLQAGKPGYIDRSPALNSFLSFLTMHYIIPDEELDEIAMELLDIINLDLGPAHIIDYLQSFLEFPSLEFAQKVAAHIMDLNNNTRNWRLKGYTPNEIYQREEKHLRPLSSRPFKQDSADYNMANSRSRTKVGRNDPCPCGSGKKYKKCCGK